MQWERMSAVRRLELRLWLGGKLHWREDRVEFDWHVVAEIDHRRLAARGKAHGLLMCGEHLQGFYERLGWERVNGPLQFDWGWGPQLDLGCTMVRVLTDDAVLPEGLIDLHGQPA